MRKRLLPFLLPLSLSAFSQNNLSSSRQQSLYTYAYRINTSEAQRLYKDGINAVSEKYLYALADSFEREEPTLPTGNYLFVRASGEDLVYELKAIGDVSYKIINNNRDLVVALHTKDGRLINNAKLSINNKALRHDEATQTYRLDKYTKEGTLQAMVAGTVYRFPVKKGYAVGRTFWQRLTGAAPLKYAIAPFKKWFGGKRQRRHNFYYGTQHEQSFKGFMVFNQPKYKPGDTVRLKAFVTTRAGKPVDKKLLLRISERSSEVDTVIATFNPYRAGGYEGSFVLSAALDLDLDEDYLVTLEEEGNSPKKPSEDENEEDEEKLAAERKMVMRGRFRYEEYELDAVTFSARSDKKEHGRGEEVSVYLKATDAAGMAVMDGRIKLTVTPTPWSNKTFTAPKVFLPDTLWQHEQAMEPLGETKITLPDSAFPHAHFNYQIECVFLNSNNERQTETLSQKFIDKPGRIVFEMLSDSLRINYLVKGKDSSTNAVLYGFTDNDDTVLMQSVRLPATVKAAPFVKTYEVETDSLDEEYEVEGRQNLVSAIASRTADSVSIQLSNPFRIPVWYTLFAGDKIVLRGYGDSLRFAEKVRTKKTTSFRCNTSPAIRCITMTTPCPTATNSSPSASSSPKPFIPAKPPTLKSP